MSTHLVLPSKLILKTIWNSLLDIKGRCRTYLFASFLLVFFSFTSMALTETNSLLNKTDSLKKKYPLSDPRHPNCPCHSFQKKAEVEYKNLMRKQKAETSLHVLPLAQSVKYHTRYLRKHKSGLTKKTVKKPQRKVFRLFGDKITKCPHW